MTNRFYWQSNINVTFDVGQFVFAVLGLLVLFGIITPSLPHAVSMLVGLVLLCASSTKLLSFTFTLGNVRRVPTAYVAMGGLMMALTVIGVVKALIVIFS